jgi:hypothetical protein
MTGTQRRLAAAWVFVVLNYLYCDVLGLMDAHLLRQFLTGTVAGMEVTGGFLLGASVLMEIPIGMVLISRVAGYRVNRAANLIAGAVMTLVQAGSLFTGRPTAYYLFFSVIEIACTVAIVRGAWTWRAPEPAPVGEATAIAAATR